MTTSVLGNKKGVHPRGSVSTRMDAFVRFSRAAPPRDASLDAATRAGPTLGHVRRVSTGFFADACQVLCNRYANNAEMRLTARIHVNLHERVDLALVASAGGFCTIVDRRAN